MVPIPWGVLGFFSFFLKVLEGGQLEFGDFTGGLFSQKKETFTHQQSFFLKSRPRDLKLGIRTKVTKV
jgi:hypothetical protein